MNDMTYIRQRHNGLADDLFATEYECSAPSLHLICHNNGSDVMTIRTGHNCVERHQTIMDNFDSFYDYFVVVATTVSLEKSDKI